jgi:hypothetical protein
MSIHLLRDPRRYVLAMMVVALVVIVPLMYGFITMTDSVFAPGADTGSVVLWVLLGAAAVGLLIVLEMMLSRATRQEEAEHEARIHGAHRAP